VKPVELTGAFDAAAPGYDRLVGANPGYHAHLRAAARSLPLPPGGRGLRLLDVGCGTGASTAALVAAFPQAEITAADASAGMLARAGAKSWPAGVRFVHAPVEGLGEAGVTGPFDGILAAYLLRNVSDRDAVLRGLRGLLRPGGSIAVHEYSVADSAVARAVWTVVCWAVIIPLAGLVTGRTALHRYLWRSVGAVDGAATFADRLRATGFRAVRTVPVAGWQRGLLHTFLAEAAS
jgi:ubiquinone/menaquinone biosynthesis C-methylase UbiE